MHLKLKVSNKTKDKNGCLGAVCQFVGEGCQFVGEVCQFVGVVCQPLITANTEAVFQFHKSSPKHYKSLSQG